jgi:hypothetical protein
MKLTGLIGGALILVLFALSGAEGADWVRIGKTKKVVIYVDKQSITRPSKNTVRAWTNIEMRAPTDPLKNAVSYDEYNCRRKRSRNLTINYYYKDGTNGTRSEEQPWHGIVPGTVDEGIFNYLCKK